MQVLHVHISEQPLLVCFVYPLHQVDTTIKQRIIMVAHIYVAMYVSILYTHMYVKPET